MYGLSKIHKPLVNGFPKLRPILSAIYWYLQMGKDMNKRHKNIKFSFETEKIIPFLSSMLRFVEKKINLQQAFSEKIRSVVYILILVVL